MVEEIKILYVEDDDAIREGMGRFLKRRFKNVYFAQDGRKGLETFREVQPDLVITDIQMPAMTGLEMTKAIKEQSPHTKVVATTAFSESQYLIRAIEAGVDRYVLKPIDKKRLLEVLDEMVQLRRAQCEVIEKNDMIDRILNSEPCFTILLKSGMIEKSSVIISERMAEGEGIQDLPIFSQPDANWYDAIRALPDGEPLDVRFGERFGERKPMRAKRYFYPVSDIELIILLPRQDGGSQ